MSIARARAQVIHVIRSSARAARLIDGALSWTAPRRRLATRRHCCGRLRRWRRRARNAHLRGEFRARSSARSLARSPANCARLAQVGQVRQVALSERARTGKRAQVSAGERARREARAPQLATTKCRSPIGCATLRRRRAAARVPRPMGAPRPSRRARRARRDSQVSPLSFERASDSLSAVRAEPSRAR